MQHYFAMLARYHLWATEKILDQIATIREEDYRQDRGLFFDSIHGTLNHMLVAELHWYARFTESEPPTLALNAEVEHDRPALDGALRTNVARWQGFIAGLEAQRFDTQLTYLRPSGEKTVTPFAASLGHVFNHGTHHRGQLSAALTGMGYACPELDLIYRVREETNNGTGN